MFVAGRCRIRIRSFVVLLLSMSVIFGSCAISAGAASFSRLNLSDVHLKGHELRITGTTDLPDGSVLEVDPGLGGLVFSGTKGGKVGVKIYAHKFSLRIKLPKGKSWRGVPAFVEVIFDPTLQRNSVKSKVGPHGERLWGPKCEKRNGIRYLKTGTRTCL